MNSGNRRVTDIGAPVESVNEQLGNPENTNAANQLIVLPEEQQEVHDNAQGRIEPTTVLGLISDYFDNNTEE